MPKSTSISTLALACLVALATLGCASSREVVVGTDPSGGYSGGDTGEAVGNPTLESELSRLVVEQKAFFETNGFYAGDLGSLDFAPGPGVRIDVIQGDSNGFSAIARSGDAECAVFTGDVRPPRGYLSSSDVPGCRG